MKYQKTCIVLLYAVTVVHSYDNTSYQVGDDSGALTTGSEISGALMQWYLDKTDNSSIDLEWQGPSESIQVSLIHWPDDVIPLTMKASINKQHVAKIQGSELFNITCVNDTEDSTFHTWKGCFLTEHSFIVTPILIGRAVMHFSVTYFNRSSMETAEISMRKFDITVVKRMRIVDRIFYIVMYSVVAVITLGMGVKIEMNVVKEHLRRPKAPIIALLSQFTFMPLLSYAIIWLQGYTGGVALGFFTMGCAPGGGSSNMYAHLLGGDLSLSVTMTLLSTMLSLAMVPLWLYTLGATLLMDEGKSVNIPFLGILQSLAAIVIPLAIGILIQYKLPRLSAVIEKYLKIGMFFMLIFVFALGLYTNLYLFKMLDGTVMLVGACLPYGGFVLGALLAWICRFEWRLIKTISIETGLQNTGIAFIVITTVFKSPEMELAAVPVVASSIMSPLPLLLATIIYTIYNKCKDRNKKNLHPEDQDDMEQRQEMLSQNG